MAELKKCPFCGGEVKIYSESVDAETEVYHFECNNCNSDTYFDFCDKEEAIEAWNTRATEAELRANVIDEFAEKMELEVSESIVWSMLADFSKEKTFDYTAEKIVDYVIDVSKRVAKQMKGEKE